MNRTGRMIAMLLAAMAAGCSKGGESSSQAAAPPPGPAPAAAAPRPAVSGASVFSAKCQTCHQVDGMGKASAFPPLGGSPYVQGAKERMARIVLRGLMGPVTINGKQFNGAMPGWAALTDEEIAAVMTYVRSSFGNHADAVTPADVAAQRLATASRTMPWTVAELPH